MWPILVAAGLGSLVGLERQVHQGLAGLRTNALVAAAAAAFVHLPYATDLTNAQPTSLAAAVISGIGFLGTGVILRDGMNVRGLNTAATLWGSAAIGAYAGSGLGWDAGGLAIVILSINLLLRPLLSKLNSITAYFAVGTPSRFSASVQSPQEHVDAARAAVVTGARRVGLHLRSLRTAPLPDLPGVASIDFELLGYGRVDLTVERFMTGLAADAGICTFAWSRAEAPDQDPLLHPGS